MRSRTLSGLFMIEFVLHPNGNELRRGVYSASEWFQFIQDTHSKGFCDTFSLTSADVFDDEYKQSVSPHHSVGPTLEFASVGQRTESDKWKNAGWLCTFIKSPDALFSFRGTDEKLEYSEYTIYTGVHMVECNCICPRETLVPVLASFLTSPQIEPDENWLYFDDAFMTHSTYKARQNSG